MDKLKKKGGKQLDNTTKEILEMLAQSIEESSHTYSQNVLSGRIAESLLNYHESMIEAKLLSSACKIAGVTVDVKDGKCILGYPSEADTTAKTNAEENRSPLLKFWKGIENAWKY